MNDERRTGLEIVEFPSGLQINRREFFKSVGAGIFILFTADEIPLLAQEGQRRPQRGVPTDFNAFLKIGEDGRVTCLVGKIEMGQGVVTSLAQELADELDVSLDSVDMVMGDTDLCPWDMGTFGSLSTRSFGPSLRKAGAEARQVLLELGSAHLHLPAEQLTTTDGLVVSRTDKRTQVSYAALAKGQYIARQPSGTVSVKNPSEFRIMSKPLTRRDAEEKVTGRAKFTADIRRPGMLYARILRPPSHASKLKNVDDSEARRVDGVHVVREGDMVAVLHKHPDVAAAAISKVKATFETPPASVNDRNIFDHLLDVAPPPKIVESAGDLTAGEKAAASIVEATYLNDYVAHAPMEPHAAVAEIIDGKATVWASTQNPFTAKGEIAKEIGFAPENVRVITPFVGGGFGGKTRNLQASEAALLAKLTGKPVQVAYTRKEEFFFDAFRPAAIVKIRSGATGKGAMCLWDYRVYFAGERGSQHFYEIPHSRTAAFNSSWVGAPGSHPFATGPWRAPGNNTNSFARESQIDMMAAKARVDPVTFRLQNLKDKKMIRVLKAAAEKFGWKPSVSPSGRGIGVACGIDAGTYVAELAQIEVNKSTGAVRVRRVVCAQDMGLVINPAGATIQVEGCITMGLGYALSERVRFDGGEILETSFDTYELPRFSWVPTIETVLIDDKEAAPQGGGEPAIITIGALVANAIFDAVGARLYQLPMTPERVKEAIGKA